MKNINTGRALFAHFLFKLMDCWWELDINCKAKRVQWKQHYLNLKGGDWYKEALYFSSKLVVEIQSKSEQLFEWDIFKSKGTEQSFEVMFYIYIFLSR